jgi:hypothetical protein
MSSALGVRVVFGVEVEADSDAVCNFIMAKLLANDNVPKYMFNHFNEYFDHFVLHKGDEPLYDDSLTDYDEYFKQVFNEESTGTLASFRQGCCLSTVWKTKIVIGVQLTHVQHLWVSPQSVDFPNLTPDMIQQIKSQLSDHGFSTDAKMFFILDDCISCT